MRTSFIVILTMCKNRKEALSITDFLLKKRLRQDVNHINRARGGAGVEIPIVEEIEDEVFIFYEDNFIEYKEQISRELKGAMPIF